MKIDGGMKLYELTIDEHGFRFRYANPHPLTGNQKFYLALAVIGAVSFVGFFAMMIFG